MKTKKITVFILLTLIGIAMSLTSCSKDETYESPQGAVTVATDWSDFSTEAVLPDTYTLRISGVAEQVMNSRTDSYTSLLDIGTYELLAYNTPENVSIEGNLASVDSEAEGTLKEPGYLFSNSRTKSVTIEGEQTSSVTIKMKQRVRQLSLVLKVGDGQKDFISSEGLTATLSGVAAVIDLATGVTSGSGEMQLNFVPNSTYDTYTATICLFGVAGEKQELLVNIQMTDGSTPVIKSDLTGNLASFGNNIDPLSLEATLQLPLTPGSGNTGSITDWVEGEIDDSNKDITVDQTETK